MFRVIITIIILILFAVLIVLNVGNTSAFNLYGINFQNVPAIVVAILSFVAGVLYSFLFYVIHFLDRRRRERLKDRARKVRAREVKADDMDEEQKKARKKALKPAGKKGATAVAQASAEEPAADTKPSLLGRIGSRIKKLFP
jgi:uncharacterized integral membrane protein